MLLPIPFHHDFKQICQLRQQLIDANNARQNSKCISYDYLPNDEVHIFNEPDHLSKFAPRASGPFKILRVHASGTLTIQRNINLQRINICRVRPYFRRSPL